MHLVIFGLLILAAALVLLGGLRMYITHQREMLDRVDGMAKIRDLAQADRGARLPRRGRHYRQAGAAEVAEPEAEPEALEVSAADEGVADEIEDPERTQRFTRPSTAPKWPSSAPPVGLFQNAPAGGFPWQQGQQPGGEVVRS